MSDNGYNQVSANEALPPFPVEEGKSNFQCLRYSKIHWCPFPRLELAPRKICPSFIPDTNDLVLV